MNRRFVDDSLILWRPGLTARLAVWDGAVEQPTQRLDQLVSGLPEQAYNRLQWSDGHTVHYSFRFADDTSHDALYGFTIAATSLVDTAVHFDSEDDADTAYQMLESVACQ